MLADVEYSISVKVQRQATEVDRDAPFAGLYARVTAIAAARCHDFGRQHQGVHHWVMCHAWRTVPAGNSSIALAIVMMGLMRPTSGEMAPPGKPAPTRQELMTITHFDSARREISPDVSYAEVGVSAKRLILTSWSRRGTSGCSTTWTNDER